MTPVSVIFLYILGEAVYDVHIGEFKIDLNDLRYIQWDDTYFMPIAARQEKIKAKVG